MARRSAPPPLMHKSARFPRRSQVATTLATGFIDRARHAVAPALAQVRASRRMQLASGIRA